jgi:hypothetical protein
MVGDVEYDMMPGPFPGGEGIGGGHTRNYPKHAKSRKHKGSKVTSRVKRVKSRKHRKRSRRGR